MKQFGDDFYTNVKELVRRNAEANKIIDILPNKDDEVYYGLVSEVLAHAFFCVNNAVDMIEDTKRNDDFIKEIVNYITGTNNKPFIISGSTGCGKTNLLAKSLSDVRTNLNKTEFA